MDKRDKGVLGVGDKEQDYFSKIDKGQDLVLKFDKDYWHLLYSTSDTCTPSVVLI